MVWCTAKNDRSRNLDKKTLNWTHSPCAKKNFFQMIYCYCVAIVWTKSIIKIHEDQRHQRSREWWKKPATIYWSFLILNLVFTLNEWYPCSSKNVHLSRKSNWWITCHSKLRITWCSVPHHAVDLVSITRNAGNFGAITLHAKTSLSPSSYILRTISFLTEIQ